MIHIFLNNFFCVESITVIKLCDLFEILGHSDPCTPDNLIFLYFTSQLFSRTAQYMPLQTRNVLFHLHFFIYFKCYTLYTCLFHLSPMSNWPCFVLNNRI
jgi:hypothetical protein